MRQLEQVVGDSKDIFFPDNIAWCKLLFFNKTYVLLNADNNNL